MTTLQMEHLGLTQLSLEDQQQTEGGFIPVAIRTYAAICSIAYFAGYGAHVVYDYLNPEHEH